MARRIDFDSIKTFDLINKDLVFMEMPSGARIISAHAEPPAEGATCVFYEGDTDRTPRQRAIQIVRTLGSLDGLPVNARFIASVRVESEHLSPFYAHLYDLGEVP